MIDFESAIDFDTDADQRVKGRPFPKEVYERPLAPELESDDSYCPFKIREWIP
jgi:hypothetical protein